MRRKLLILGALVLLLLAVSMLAGCDVPASLPGPTVYLDFGESFQLKPLMVSTRWTAEEMTWIYKGAQAWRQLGYDVRPLGEPIDGSLDPANVVVIQIYRDEWIPTQPNLSNIGALSDRETISTFIRSDLQEFRLMSTAAHEIGHQLLQTSEHLPQSDNALMSPASIGWRITDADLALACRVAARCRRY